jgi:hypothetical protein
MARAILEASNKLFTPAMTDKAGHIYSRLTVHDREEGSSHGCGCSRHDSRRWPASSQPYLLLPPGYWCPGRELNPHSPCGEKDFKSFASADFATRA